MSTHPRAGQPARRGDLVDVPALVSAYYTETPDPGRPAERVSFGTSGHRGSSLDRRFNEAHVLAIVQAVCDHRSERGIDGPLFLGRDTHALSTPAAVTALEVLAANGVAAHVDHGDGPTPTPLVSHAILVHNRGRERGRADGVVITPSHNPPRDGGLKYNPPTGGPADATATRRIERRANEILDGGNADVRRVPAERARRQATPFDFVAPYVRDLPSVLDMEAVAACRLGVDPMGGAGIDCWGPIAEAYGLDLTVVSDVVDPAFSFMTLDHDGKIRMDCSSPHAMARLIGMRDRFEVAVGNDTDYDRHGIVTPDGLLPPNHYLAVCIAHLFPRRDGWSAETGVGKTAVSSAILDRVVADLGRPLVEVPVGFKWFVDGLTDGSLGFVGEESAGATFLRRDGGVWTTDKDGILLALLAAEITAKAGRHPGELYRDLTARFGDPVYERIDAPVEAEGKARLLALRPEDVKATELAGEPIESVVTTAPGNGQPLGGVKVSAASGWFAVRPSGTEDIYKIYAESFRDRDHLRRIQQAANVLAGHD